MERSKAEDVVDLCQRAAGAWNTRMFDNTILKLQCWDEEEADKVSSYMKKNYPEVKFFTTYMEFK